MHNTTINSTTSRVCLIVIDGWGVSDASSTELDAIAAAPTPNMTQLQHNSLYTTLVAHGSDVGLPAGLMGNSEVGHLNIGAGRIVYQDITRIDRAFQDGSFKEKLLLHLSRDKHIHLVGLVSDGGVHSSLEHLLRITEMLQDYSFTIHAITDGRDTAPKSAMTYLRQVYPHLGTVVGRYYAMDRDKRWERIHIALDAFTTTEPQDLKDQFSSLEELDRLVNVKYESNETDEFFKPIFRTGSRRIQPDDTVLFFNFRSDRMRQIVSKFADMKRTGKLLCMTRYSEEFDLPVLSPPQSLTNVLSECIANANLSQCHIAGTPL